ncbi:MAG TPA: Ig-like domain-containing protein [Terriglobia bacterium]|nr:Ig-like domain-containing protein [Terriglobia bacterium]
MTEGRKSPRYKLWGTCLMIPLCMALTNCGSSPQSANSPLTLVSVALTPSTPSVAVSGTVQLTATGTYSNGSTQTLTSSATWTSSNTSDATVQSAGQATPGLAAGVAIGSVTITAAVNGVMGTATLTVTAPVLTSVTVSPTSASVQVGATQQFTATAQYNNNTSQNVTNLAAWSSSAAPGTVTSGGLATGVTPGSTTITATYNGVSGTATLLVASGTLPALFVGPAATTVAPGSTLQFTATETLLNGTTQNVTSLATWTSSNASFATVESAGAASPGLANGVAVGFATITATYSGLTATASLNVNTASSAMIPLMDMTPSQNYFGFSGGLYGGGSDAVPAAHDADGLAIAGQIQPLDANGNPSASGKVVLVSIGMSNAADEFGQFVQTANKSPLVNNTTLAIANGAKGGITACYWTVANGPVPCGSNTANQFDRVLTDVLTPLGVTEAQVQAVWLKEANGGPGVSGCGSGGDQPCNTLSDLAGSSCSAAATPAWTITVEACRYENQMGEIIRAAKTRWPNLKVAFLTSRIYGGYATVDVNPEPYAYEYGYSVQWFIQAQINQIQSGTIDPVAGDLSYKDGTAPWLAWGPYIWANGTTPRSDGLLWCNNQTSAPCYGEEDFQNDGTHPDTLGQEKVAYGINTVTTNPGQTASTSSPTQNLLYFFLNSPYTKAWFAAAP